MLRGSEEFCFSPKKSLTRFSMASYADILHLLVKATRAILFHMRQNPTGLIYHLASLSNTSKYWTHELLNRGLQALKSFLNQS